SLGSTEAAKCISAGIWRVLPDAVIDVVPIADGGEGTAVTLTEALGGKLNQVSVQGPMADTVNAVFGILPGGEAVLDMASASGLTLIQEGKKDILAATTYGVGQLISAALDQGCQRIYLGIGGSATNDGGIGMAQALGVRFLDDKDRNLSRQASAQPLPAQPSPSVFLAGRHLSDIAAIDLSGLDPRLLSTEILVLCDVTNPLCGPLGASHVYGPQKGADPTEIALLDEGLSHLAALIQQSTNRDLAELPGAGAAGGLGFGLMAFTNAKLHPGIDFMLTAADFDDKISRADLVITGEGRLDRQSAFGKTPAGIAHRCAASGTPVIAIGGAIEGSMSALYEAGISAIEAAVCAPIPLAEAMEKAPAYLTDAAERIIRAISLGSRLNPIDQR
ncbi:MAG: glycerate kinase, partial [Peptococcaceae bacterium]|nr:glycerate kinase [Peptococcaceae bacterium]